MTSMIKEEEPVAIEILAKRMAVLTLSKMPTTGVSISVNRTDVVMTI